MDAVEFIKENAAELEPRLNALSRTIWEHPETAFHEEMACSMLQYFLQEEGFRITEKAGGLKTAFIAEAGKGEPVIGFLGEYDALPGLSTLPDEPDAAGHGCGHNLLGVGSAGAAVLAKRVLEAAGLPGTVRFYGCPAEESGGGKEILADAGVFAGTSACITWHPDRVNRVIREASLANAIVRASFRGKSAHAATAAFNGRSALDACELMNVGANYLREHVTPDVRFHYAYTDCGGPAPNVVPDKAELVYYIRARDGKAAEAVTDRIEKIARGAALMTETEVDFRRESLLKDTLPNDILGMTAAGALRELGAPDFTPAEQRAAAHYCPDEKEALDTSAEAYASSEVCFPFSTDVGNVSYLVPTVQVYMACFAKKTPFHTRALTEQAVLPAAFRGMNRAAEVMALTAVRLYIFPEILQKAEEERLTRLEKAEH